MGTRGSQTSVARELPSQAAWMRRIARGLVRDDSTADDLVQQAALQSLRRSPRSDASTRSWLGTVIANVARRRWRDERSRNASEVVAARPEAQPSASEVAERLEVVRAVAQELHSLSEPYRTTLYLRYFEAWSAARIARDQRVPAPTVRWRIQRGLELLRERLDRRAGGRTNWQLALLPLAMAPTWPWLRELPFGPTATSTTFSGAIAMKSVQICAAAVLLAAAGVGVWWGIAGPRADEPVGEAAASALGQLAPEETLRAPEALHRQEVEVAATSLSPADAPPSAPDTAQVLARVVDASRRPVAGARASEHERPDFATAAADENGAIRLECVLGTEREQRVLRIEAEGFGTAFVAAQLVRGATTQLGELTLQPGGAVAGRVVDERGAPIPGASLVVTGPDLVFPQFDVAKRRGPQTWPGAVTGETATDGTFRIHAVAAGAVRVWASRPPSRFAISEAVEVRGGSVTDAGTLVVEDLRLEDEIAGIVVAPDGAPVAKASVALGVTVSDNSSGGSMPADEDGRFRWRVTLAGPHRITASDPSNRWRAVTVEGVPPGTHDLVLRLDENRFLDLAVRSGGDPVTRFDVVVRDELGFVIEDSGDLARDDGLARLRVPERRFLVEVVAAGYAVAREGPFDPQAAPPRLDLELDLERGLSGVVSSAGEPVAGARVTLWKRVDERTKVEVDGCVALVHPLASDECVTGDDGRFELRVREPAAYVVRAEVAGFAPSETEPIEAVPGAAPSDLRLALVRGGAIEGRVRVAPGRSAAGVIVGLHRGDAFPRTIRSGADGSFRAEALTPGPWRIFESPYDMTEDRASSTSTGSAPMHRPALVFDCEVRDGETTSFDLDLTESPECILAGRLAINGRAARDWTVVSSPEVIHSGPTPLSPATLLDPEGRFRLTCRERGPVRLELRPPSDLAPGCAFEVRTELDAAENLWEADFEMGRLEGRYADPSTAADPCTFSSDGPGPSCRLPLQADAAGRFALPFAPAGPGRIVRWRKDESGTVEETVLEVNVVRAETLRVEIP